MYAIVEAGGKQHRVTPGQRIKVEREWSDAQPGSTVEFQKVLLVRTEAGVRVGSPLVPGATVKATVIRACRGEKIIVFKKKRRKGYRRTKGHRQNFFEVRIDAIWG